MAIRNLLLSVSGAALATHPAFSFIDGDASLTPDTGFGPGNHYMLPVESGALVVEPNEGTLKVHFSTTGVTFSDVNTAEGTSFVDDFQFADWVYTQQNGTNAGIPAGKNYGLSEEHPISSAALGTFIRQFDAGIRATLPGDTATVWFLLAGGETHTSFRKEVFEIKGESALHPNLVGSYGTGRAIIDLSAAKIALASGGNHSLVFRDLDLTGVFWEFRGGFSDLLSFNNIYAGEDTEFSVAATIGRHNRLTFCRDKFMDSHKSAPSGGGNIWPVTEANRIQGLYGSDADNMLINECFFDHNGWVDGYDFNRSFPPGQVPDKYSHNFYGAVSLENLTVRQTWTSRAASQGFQFRSGAYKVECVAFDNNIAFALTDPDAATPDLGNYDMTLDTVIMSAGCRNTDSIDLSGNVQANITFVSGVGVVTDGLVIAHGFNPNNPTETNETGTQKSTFNGNSFDPFDAAEQASFYLQEMVKHDWLAETDFNTGGLVEATMDDATLHRWADQDQSVAFGTTTTNGVCAYLRTLEHPAGKIPDMLEFILPAFGYPYSVRTVAQTVTFDPWPSGEGYRADNPRNWDARGVPGSVAGDSIALAGNTATSYLQHDVSGFDMGTLGEWRQYSNRVKVSGSFAGTGTFSAYGGGQLYLDGTTAGAKTVNLIDAGRLAVSGTASALTVNADTYSEIVVRPGGSLTVAGLTLTGKRVRCGFDGQTGTGTLTLSGAIDFVAGGDDSLPTIKEFVSGIEGFDANGNVLVPAITSTVVLGGDLTVDVTGLVAATYTLIDVDSLSGSFASTTVTGGTGSVSVDTGAGTVTVTVT